MRKIPIWFWLGAGAIGIWYLMRQQTVARRIAEANAGLQASVLTPGQLAPVSLPNISTPSVPMPLPAPLLPPLPPPRTTGWSDQPPPMIDFNIVGGA